MIRTLPYADLLEHGQEALVLTTGALVRLSALGAAVLRLADGGIETGELTEALTAEFGVPESGSAEVAVAAVLEVLADQRLIQITAGA